jgi:hypothetical protein
MSNDFWKDYEPEPVKPAQQEFVLPGGGYIPAIPAQQALDKKAENARELGLDYEPPCKTGGQCTSKCQQCAVQEPVAWISHNAGLYHFKPDESLDPLPLYLAPPAQPTPVQPVAWAIYQRGRLQSFWLDKGDAYDFEFTTEHQWQPLYTPPPAAQRQWVGLTGNEIVNMLPDDDTPMSLGEAFFKFAELVEAKLKEKNGV